MTGAHFAAIIFLVVFVIAPTMAAGAFAYRHPYDDRGDR
jgi:hypothetical protein